MEANIFGLKTKKDELDSLNAGMMELFYREVQPLRNVSDSQPTNPATNTTAVFGQGNISMRWTLDNQTWWIPAKSYFKARVVIKNRGFKDLNVEDQIGPSMGLMPNILNKIQFKMADQTVSSLNENLGECEAMMNRLYHGGDWMRKMGQDTNFWGSSLNERIQRVSSDGVSADVVNKSLSLNRFQLGLGSTFIQAAMTVRGDLTFSLLAGGVPSVLPDFSKIFQIGDYLIIKFTEDPNDSISRGGFVLARTIAGVLKLAMTPQDIANPTVATNKFTIKLIRYTSFTLDENLLQVNGTFQIDNTNEMTILNDTFHKLDQLDFLHVLDNGVTFRSHLVSGPINANQTSFQNFTSSLSAAFVAPTGAARRFRYEIDEIISGQAMGYTNPPAQANSHALVVTQGAAGIETKLTFFKNDAATDVPDVNDLYRVGDMLIIFADQNVLGALPERRYFFVLDVDPDRDGLSVNLVAMERIAATFGLANDGRSFIERRVRFKRDLLEPVQESRQTSEFDVMWTPKCLGVFNLAHAIPGGTKFEMEVTPQPNSVYQLRGIETHHGRQLLHNLDYKFLVTDFKLYIAQCKAQPVENMSYYLDMQEIRCNKQTLTSSNTQQTTIDVVPSTYALSLAFQDTSTGQTTDLSSTKFKIRNDEELQLTRYSIRFGGRSLPSPDAQILVDANLKIENIAEYFYRNQMYSGTYYNDDSESIAEWKERGIYFHHPFLRSANNNETTAYIITQFKKDSGFQFTNNAKLLLFEHYRKIAIITIKDGRVESIRTSFS